MPKPKKKAAKRDMTNSLKTYRVSLLDVTSYLKN